MLQSRRAILLSLLLAIAFSASALHPYDHDLQGTERLDCQVCLHHALSPLAAGHPPLQLPAPAFEQTAILAAEQNRPAAATLPARRARGPPVSA